MAIMSNDHATKAKGSCPTLPESPSSHDMTNRSDHPPSAPSCDRVDARPCAAGAPPVRLGGGRTPRPSESYVDSRLPMPAQFFMILGEGAGLGEYLRSKLEFHCALFPFVDLPDMEVH